MNVTEATLRPAYSTESDNQKGGFFWRLGNAPWNFAMKILGTWELRSKKGNFLEIQPPRPLQYAHNIKWLAGCAPERDFIRTVPSFVGVWHLIEDQPKVAEEFFRHVRVGEVFEQSESMVFICDIIRKAFPSVKNEDFILTCSAEKNKLLHSLLQRHLNRNVSEMVKQEAAETVRSWADRCNKGENINAAIESRMYASRVISRMAFGMPKGDENMAAAVNFINYFIVKTILRTVTPEDRQKFNEAVKTFKKATEEVLQFEKTPLFDESKLTLEEQQAMIFAIFFAGQETVGALMSYILWKLAKDPDLQRRLQDECDRHVGETERIKAIHELFVRSIGEFPPAYGVSRILKHDTCLEFKVEGETITRKYVFYKGEKLVVQMKRFAEKQLPHLDNQNPSYQSWMPFGGGANRCPGENLAKSEIYEFLVAILSNYDIHTNQTHEIPKIGAMTLQLKEDINITLTPRKKV